MKKVLVFLSLTLALLLCLVSCFGQTEHTHKFTEWSTTKNATCTEDGVKTRYCDCGEKQSDVLPAIGHNYIDGECANCGDVKECKHENLDVLSGKEATCTETGLTEGIKCSDCGDILLAQQEIPLEDHTEEIIPAVEPTCTKTGLTEGVKCSDCGDILLAQQEIPVEHHYEDDQKCTVCQQYRPEYGTEGLAFKLSEDGSYYILAGFGQANTYDLICPAIYNGLPVKEIGGGFCETGLRSIVIPNSVTVIDSYAFSYTDLDTLIIPDSVTFIGFQAFAYSSLTSISIPNSVTSIDDAAFTGCSSLSNITVESNNPFYKSIDGSLYDKNGEKLIQYALGKTDSTFIIPEGVTQIGSYAFHYAYSLTSVTIPNSVTSIDDAAFHYATSLTSVTMGNGVTSIGEGAFYWCSSLTSITIPNSVTIIGEEAFYWCSSLTSITIPNSVTIIGEEAFSSCSSLITIKFEGAVARWIAISKGDNWNHKVQATYVQCSDGTIRLN